MIKLQLHENWQLCDIKKQDWIPAQVPGDIYSALLKAEKMPDPFFGDNEYQAKALMEEDYEYRTVFTYDEKQFENCQEVILRFDGIDTIADIYLNECYLGKADNMHRVWEFPVGELLQEGENTLRVIIRSPLKFMAEAFKKYKNIGNEDTVEGFMHLRKAHYMSGWDWGACLPDGGIFRPVTLLGIESARLDSVYIRQVHEDGKVLLIPEVDVETVDEAEIDTDEKNSAEMPDQGVESEADEDLLEYEVTVTAPDGTKIVSDGSPDEIVIENPQFWWPNGLGEQPLYQVQVDLKAGDKTVDTWCKKIGLRTLTMHIEKELERISHTPRNYVPYLVAVGAGFACGGFCKLFGCDWMAFLLASISAFVGFRVRARFIEFGVNVYMSIAIAAFVSTCLAYASSFTGWSSTPYHPLLACALFIVPGVPLINFVDDMIDNYLLVGITRAANTVMMVGAMAFGIVLAIRLCVMEDVTIDKKFSELSMIPHDPYYVYAIAAAIAAMGFSMIFNIQRRLLWVVAIGGIIAVCTRNFVNFELGFGPVIGSFMGSFVVSLIAVKAVHWFHVPNHVLTIPSVIPMIPGVLMYRSLLGFIDMHGVVGEVTVAFFNGINSALIILCIALGVAVPNIFARRYIAKDRQKCLEEELKKRKARGKFIEW